MKLIKLSISYLTNLALQVAKYSLKKIDAPQLETLSFHSMYSFQKPGTYITNNATQPLTGQSDNQVVFLSNGLCSLKQRHTLIFFLQVRRRVDMCKVVEFPFNTVNTS